METTTFVGSIGIGLLTGIAGFSFSYACFVWRKRNRSGSGRSQSILPFWAKAAFAVGAALMVLTVAYRETASRQGRLNSEGVYALRIPEDFQLDFLAESAHVSADDVLARLASPVRQARIEQLRAKQKALEAEKRALEQKPLDLDPELVRQLQNSENEQRRLLTALDQLAPAHDGVVRTALTEKLALDNRIRNLAKQRNQLSCELQQQKSKLKFFQRQTDRSSALAQSGAASQVEYEQQALDLQVMKDELEKNRQLLQQIENEKQQLADRREELATVFDEHINGLGSRVGKITKDLAREKEQLEHRRNLLQNDRQRAEALKEQNLKRITAEIEQTAAEIKGLQESLRITAPFGGRIVYRSPSPQMALPDEPLLVLSQEDGLEVELRLRTAEAEALAEEKQVLLELDDSFLQRRFTGKLKTWKKMPNDEGYALVTLASSLPKESIQQLASQEKLTARLLWKPPLYSYPTFLIGLAAFIAGTISAAAGVFKAKELPERQTAEPEPDADEDNAAAETAAEHGAEGAILRLLGDRLAESVRQEQLDANLFSAVEWALDRHHVRAISQIRPKLQTDDFEQNAIALLEKYDKIVHKNGSARPLAQLKRILRVLAPQLQCDLRVRQHQDVSSHGTN